ncbi:DNA-directed RNA polymerase subunit E'' [Candidatus Pacearchaeota archaeon]|nr:DNA-directed RNA polymerase subunit E'' [Candidatus Pacearchaeota archaeon]
MAVKEKACVRCKTIYEGEKCPHCDETASSDSFKGEAFIFNPEKSMIANKMKVTGKGRFAIKTR